MALETSMTRRPAVVLAAPVEPVWSPTALCQGPQARPWLTPIGAGAKNTSRNVKLAEIKDSSQALAPNHKPP